MRKIGRNDERCITFTKPLNLAKCLTRSNNFLGVIDMKSRNVNLFFIFLNGKQSSDCGDSSEIIFIT